MTLTRFYAGLSVVLLALWALATLGGWEPTPSERQDIPPSVRNSPGGYRSYHFWYMGTHGGK